MRHLKVPALVMLALCSAMAAAQPAGQVQTVTVTLSNFRFTPSTLTLQRGQSYRLHFVNSASGGHNFVAKSFFASSAIAPEDRGKVKDGELALHGGQSVDILLVPGQAGTYESHCSHFMHSSFGMKGTVIVQ
ncbi:cupredoxin domain-containing protein [Sphingobium sp. EM0848]|uniref:cupredoxin domain-containing protein n=1 Tax=Sphingobium sp. EM0848 TaxID=2743473 RepID=UPI00159CACC3|nr:cupredoxin domain-containing protein [Sphingobium sp. EM0848]